MHSSEINANDGTVILSSVLKIIGITLSDAGEYQCRAGDPNFPPVNKTATLTVQCEFLMLILSLLLILFPAPPIVRATSNNVIGIITQEITLKFNITGDTPLVTHNNIHWQFNGTDLVGGDTVVFSDNRFSVTLSNLSLSDEGFYTVTATNPAGSDMDSLFLDVEGKKLLLVFLTFFYNYSFTVPPILIEGPADRLAVTGTNVEFHCLAKAEPVHNIQWLFNNGGEPLVNSEKYRLSDKNSRLVVINVMLNDMGTYTCITTNVHGMANSTATLQVQGNDYIELL